MTLTADDDGDLALLPAHLRPTKRRRDESTTYSAANVDRALEGLTTTEWDALVTGLLVKTQRPRVVIDVRCQRESVYLVGRYRKLNRVMPQTPWIVDGQRKGTRSVEEILAAAIAEQTTGVCKFRASGREDADVRMLGTGRPFGMDIVNPSHDHFDIVAFEAAVRRISGNTPVEVTSLEVTDKNKAHSIDADVDAKRKTYACIVWFQKPLTTKQTQELLPKTLRIFQKTPVRVMHSRSLATRERTIYDLRLDLLNTHFGTLRLTTAAGTYIKEFVHGDLGRTTPSLCSLLGCRTDILQLDVLDVFSQDDDDDDDDELRQ